MPRHKGLEPRPLILLIFCMILMSHAPSPSAAYTLEKFEERCLSSFSDYPGSQDNRRTVQELKNDLSKGQVRNAGQFREWMASQPKYRPFLSQFAVVLASQGAQPSSFKKPRIVAYNGGLFMGMPGHASGESPASATTLEFWEANENRSPPATFYSVDLSVSPPKIEENPHSCLECHGNPPFGRWDTLSFWPGTGSQDEPTLNLEMVDKKDPYYAGFNWESEVAARGGYFMGRAIAPYQFGWVAKQIMSDQVFFERYRYALLGALGRCSNIESFIPQPMLSELYAAIAQKFPLDQNNFKSLADDTKKVMDSDFQSRLDRYEVIRSKYLREFGHEAKPIEEPSNRDLKELDVVTAMRLMIEGNGKDMGAWSISNYAKSGHRSYSYSIESDFQGLKGVACFIIPDLFRKDPFVKNLLTDKLNLDDKKIFESEHKEAICKSLQENSLEVLSKPKPADAEPHWKRSKPLRWHKE